jgi:type I restriction enzyme S subunit
MLMEKLKGTEISESFFSHKNRVYPKAWHKVRIDEVADIVSGGTPSSYNLEFWRNEIPWATPSDITNNGKYISDTERKISEQGMKNSSASLLPINSILMCSRASIGPRSLNTVPMTTNQGFKSFVCIKDKLDWNYFYYLIGMIDKDFKRLACGSTFLEISKGDISKYEIVIPRNLHEQQKIAEILSTWDKAIELKEKLIEEKKKQKTGLMQLLLTGKVRLPGFDGEWKEEKIGDIAKQSTNKNSDNKISKVLSCTKYNGLVDSLSYFGKQIYSDDISKYKTVHKGEICYATNHIEEGSIGILEEYDAGVVSPMYTVFKVNKEQDNAFVYLVLKSPMYVEYYKSLMSASVNRRGSLRWNTFKNIIINCPPIEEQKVLADFFKQAEKSIELHEKELKALKLQKKGLMQLLLTGIVRVNKT